MRRVRTIVTARPDGGGVCVLSVRGVIGKMSSEDEMYGVFESDEDGPDLSRPLALFMLEEDAEMWASQCHNDVEILPIENISGVLVSLESEKG